MPAIAVLIGGVLLAIAERLALRVATAIGFGVVAYAGLSQLIDGVKAAVFSQVGSLSSGIASMLGLMGLGVALNIIFSAYVIRATLAGLKPDGVLKKFGSK